VRLTISSWPAREPEVADALRHFGATFGDRYGTSTSAARRSAMSATESCRAVTLLIHGA
jgi:hypothetical protein